MISYFLLSDRNLIVGDSWISIQQSTAPAPLREAHPEISRCEFIILFFVPLLLRFIYFCYFFYFHKQMNRFGFYYQLTVNVCSLVGGFKLK